jgi:hypothetical protein
MDALADRAKETTTTTGTGDITTAGAVAQFQTINTAIGQNVYCSYVLVDADGVDWETGTGYLSAATTFKRTFVRTSTNGNAAINLSAGTHTIFIDATASYFLNMTGKMLAMSKSAPMP